MAERAARRVWEAQGDEKRTRVRRMFADISPTYDLLNSAMSLRLHHRWRADAVRGLNLAPGGSALDVCCGTGDFGRPLRRALGSEGEILGVDFCMPMLKLAAKKPYGMGLSLGDACALPVGSETFDAITVGWGLRNVPDLEAALSEVCRVLKPGGRFVSVDMALPGNAFIRGVSGFIFNRIVPLLGAVFSRKEAYVYLPKSTETFAGREEIVGMMRGAGFRDVRYEDRFFGNICIHWGIK